MSFTLPGKGTGTRRAVAKVAELRDENWRLLSAYHQAGDHVALLQLDLTTARTRQVEAEEIVIQQQADLLDLTDERDQLAAEVEALKAAVANANAVDVPQVGHRDIDPGNEVTVPVPIVKTLAEAHGQGRAATDPARTTWGMRNEQAGVAG